MLLENDKESVCLKKFYERNEYQSEKYCFSPHGKTAV